MTTLIKAKEPKRARGKLRVAAILDAAAAVFAEKGYDAATMTEIAARAQTAIGSLYQFFPTKAVLGDALVDGFKELLDEALNEIAARAASLDASALADALVDVFVDMPFGLQPERGAALAVVLTRSDSVDRRAMLADAARGQIATILATATSGALAEARAGAMAMLLLHVLRAIPVFANEAGSRERLVSEARDMVRLYIANAFGEAVSPDGASPRRPAAAAMPRSGP